MWIGTDSAWTVGPDSLLKLQTIKKCCVQACNAYGCWVLRVLLGFKRKTLPSQSATVEPLRDPSPCLSIGNQLSISSHIWYLHIVVTQRRLNQIPRRRLRCHVGNSDMSGDSELPSTWRCMSAELRRKRFLKSCAELAEERSRSKVFIVPSVIVTYSLNFTFGGHLSVWVVAASDLTSSRLCFTSVDRANARVESTSLADAFDASVFRELAIVDPGDGFLSMCFFTSALSDVSRRFSCLIGLK